ncbi:hypothetical protein CFC21_079237 [Triticum aestivum]|uniref:Ricin B lectin domain-containing protein n=2 Tax=Triticum aestivum TaxID=4565 RepID=A0A9R1L1Q9_WHEAT|nr:hypothetical protein CFC21_079237 [Triticum aestivum]
MAYTFRIHCRASDDLSLALVDGEVVLAAADPSDDRQLWQKDVMYAGGVKVLKDEAGNPAFALVNKATGDALKHSLGYNLPVRAIRFNPGYLDESVLWAETGDVGGGYRLIHMVNNMDYIFDAEKATPQFGGARDGTRLILFRWNRGHNQLWRISDAPAGRGPPVRVSCECNNELSLAIRDGAAVLARTDLDDDTQAWVQSFRNTGRVTDSEGRSSFALVNKSTGKALRRSHGDQKVEVVSYSLDSVDVALLWTTSGDLREGSHCIRSVSNLGYVLDASEGETTGAHDGTPVISFQSHSGANQKWKTTPFPYLAFLSVLGNC